DAPGSPEKSLVLLRRVADADDPAGQAVAGVAGRLRRQIVRIGVHDQAPADDRMLAVQANDAIVHVDGGDAVRAGNDIAEIADVPLGVPRPPVFLAGRIEMAARALRIGAVAELMDVEAVLAGLEAAHLAGDVHHVTLLR